MDQNCRMCLQENTGNIFTSFSYKLECDLSVHEIYELFTSINVENEQEQNKSKICQECLHKLLAFNMDRCQAITNNSILCSWNNKNNIKKELHNDPLIHDYTHLPEVKLEDKTIHYGDFQNLEDEKPLIVSRTSQRAHHHKISKSEALSYVKKKVLKKRILAEGCTNNISERVLGDPKKQFIAIKKKIENHSNEKLDKKYGRKVLCPVCGISVRVDALKKHHERVHLNLNRFFCDICSRGFYSKYMLRDHMARHFGEPTVPCIKEGCTKMFFSMTDRRVHMSAVHTNRNNDHICTYPMCSLTYDTVGKLNNHIKYTHLRERKHICPNCHEGFFAPKHLKEHMTKYLEKNLICDGCGNFFNSLKKLKLHFIQTHMTAPLACSICGKKFKRYQKKSMKLHELDHQSIRNHSCQYCDKKFKTSSFTLEHIRAVHFKSKIKCELCGRSFPRPGYYKVHVKTKHEDLGAEKIEEWLARIEKMRPDYEKLEWTVEF